VATTKYFVLPSSPGANFTDFDLSYGTVRLSGEQVSFVGSSAVDAVFVRPGVTVDFTLSGSGADKIYLGGNFAWVNFTDALGVGSRKAVAAAKTRNVDAVLSAGDAIYEACEGCHTAYMKK